MQFLEKVFNFSAQRHLKTAGDLFIYHEDYAGALEQVERSLALDPTDTRALVLYGDILFCMSRDMDALRVLNKAILLDEHLPEAHISKGGVLEVMGKFREALCCYRKALGCIELPKAYLLPNLFDQKIMVLIRMKRFREAQVVLTQAAHYLEEEALDYLQFTYRGLLEQLCQQRRRRRTTQDSKQPLRVLAGS
jgi:tetratricopeptide (TPR) repeat protein